MESKAVGGMPAPAGVVADLNHPQDVLRTVNFVTQGLTLFIISFFVIVRALSRVKMVGFSLEPDDYGIFISYILLVGYCICGIFLSVYGGGYHLWEVPQSNLQSFFKSGYAATIFYAPMTLFVKLSLLYIMARVFGPYKKTVTGLYVFMGLLVAYYTSQLIVKIRICYPISAYWKGESEKCLNQSAVITADSIISTVSDIAILVLPLPLTWSLQLPRNKKLRVVGMLGVGGLATAFSIWRLHLILVDGSSADQTIVFVKVVLSGNAEIGIGLICACLPAVTAFITRVKERSFNSYRSRNKNSHLGSSDAFKMSNVNSSARAAKERQMRDVYDTGSDQAELVSYAQGIPGTDSTRRGGIERKVEVEHTITYHGMEDEESNDSRHGNR